MEGRITDGRASHLDGLLERELLRLRLRRCERHQGQQRPATFVRPLRPFRARLLGHAHVEGAQSQILQTDLCSHI